MVGLFKGTQRYLDLESTPGDVLMNLAEDVSCAHAETQIPVISGQRAEDAVKLTSTQCAICSTATRLSENVFQGYSICTNNDL